jgi:hypothetical protein
MIVLNENDERRRNRSQSRHVVPLPRTRRSILDPLLESEPWLDFCGCTNTGFLFVNNRPIASIVGTPLDCRSASIRLSQLRHRNPRQRV